MHPGFPPVAAHGAIPGIVVLALLAVLAACTEPQPAPPPRESVSSHFVAGQSDTIEIAVVDPLPVKSALLKVPDGQTLAAERIERDRNLYSSDTGYGPNVGLKVQGGSTSGVSTGIGFGFPLLGGEGSGERTTSMTTSTIRFRIPDMEAYRRDWQRWILHLELDDGANRRTIETLPPAPPPE